jgi:hypothetical protein
LQKAEYRQEAYRKSLNAKLELHGILQEVLQDRVARRADASFAAAALAAAGPAPAAASSAAASGGSGDPAPGAAASASSSFEQLLGELEAVRSGKELPPATVVKVAQLFKDELTVDNLPRGQLAALGKFLGISPFAPEPLLRFQLRVKMKAIREDDRDLVEEGTAALDKGELEAACEARGMRAIGLEEADLRRQLDEWLGLSVGQKVPLTLLLLSRAFQIATVRPAPAPAAAPAPAEAAAAAVSKPAPSVGFAGGAGLTAASASMPRAALAAQPAAAAAPSAAPAAPAAAAAAPATDGAAAAARALPHEAQKALQESISTLDANVLNEVLLAATQAPGALGGAGPASGAGKTAVMAMKLEAIEFQNELIAAEREAMVRPRVCTSVAMLLLSADACMY